MAERVCKVCGKLLVRREGETPSQFAARKTCGGACGAKVRQQTLLKFRSRPFFNLMRLDGDDQ